MVKGFCAAVLVAAMLMSVAAADFDSAFAAYKRGDYETAFVEYKVLADQGDARAQSNLGNMYEFGEGVPEDDREAVKWYRLAAEQGNYRAQHNLGIMYRDGEGVPEDYVQAYAWYNLAAAQGNSFANRDKSELAERMTPSQIAEAQRLSKELWEKIPRQ
jgi:TPR repeat protein